MSSRSWVSSVGGNSNAVNIVNVGGKVTATGQGKEAGVTNLSACGTVFSGQADHVTVSGLC
jgi:hypothetical protein